ncbi:glutamine synthetase III [Candidatus Sumerlaeota bacterium]|nr:glutamine synthetase III [Candidatus Sumerlaeota bacterium]
MSTKVARLHAMESIANTEQPVSTFDYVNLPTGKVWAENVFCVKKMQERLPDKAYKALKRCIDTGCPLNKEVADAVAEAMKLWALEKGATHYAHVFYPLTGLTAEKHDSFFQPDGAGGMLAQFEGKMLIQGEPDGSSFPSGGIRQTFEARGYTIWDATSPAYIMESPNGATLCIPTAFVSWTGEALDKKTPLLRSMQALNKECQRVLKFFGTDGAYVRPTAGAEQEYFLVDKNFYHARPDLMAAGRTLFGANPPKGQELEDHYFGVIQPRVMAFMFEVERELFKLGIPVKTRHNEVAPAQFEVAPLHECANVATDHQQQIMVTLKKVAEKFGMVCLLHEKPFAGINGSGKHLNYSLASPVAGNLFDPGDTPEQNAQFLLFCAAMIQAVRRWAKLLRAVVASASNDHRLGANEAPPAVISIFLGDELTEIIEGIAKGAPITSRKSELHIGVDVIPPIPMHSGDRNRTSPMAFTGNRFEFRAVGSSQSIGGPLVALNTILAESLGEFAQELENANPQTPEQLGQVVEQLVKSVWESCSNVVFNGDGYSLEWHAEAARRGLPNLKTAADALPAIKSKETIALFKKFGVLSERETQSRYDVYAEQYIASINVESNLVVKMVRTIFFPAAIRYQSELALSLANLKAVGIEPDHKTIDKMTELIRKLQDSVSELEAQKQREHNCEDIESHCQYVRDAILPKIEEIRGYVDTLEGMIPDDLWALPTYQEMLFVR